MIFELNRLGVNNGVIEWRLDCNRNNWTKPLLFDNSVHFTVGVGT